MKPQTISYILFIATVLFLTGCGVHRQSAPAAVSVGNTVIRSERDFISVLNQNDQFGSLRTSADAEIKMPNKSFSSRVNLTIVRGKGIRMILIPLPFVELGRIWITPTGVTATDAIHKYYAELSYAELSKELGMPIDYESLESLLCGRLFTPEHPKGNPLDYFRFSQTTPSSIVYPGQNAEYQFSMNTSGRIGSAYAITKTSDRASVLWKYDQYQNSFPLMQTVVLNRLKGKKDSVRITLQMDDADSEAVDATLVEPKVKSNYQRISLPVLKQMIKNLL